MKRHASAFRVFGILALTASLLLSVLVLPSAAMTDEKLLLHQDFEGSFSSGAIASGDIGKIDIVHKKPITASGTVEGYSTHTVASASASDPNRYLKFSITDAAAGKTVTKDGDSYIDMVLYNAADSSYDLFNVANANYYTFDMDFATDEIGYDGTLQMVGRAGTAFKSCGSVPFSTLGITSANAGEWVHVTIVLQVARVRSGERNVLEGSKAYVYANGVYKTTFTVDSGAQYINCVRITPSITNNAPQTLMIDNVAVRSYGAEPSLSILMSSTAKKLTDVGYPYYTVPGLSGEKIKLHQQFEGNFNSGNHESGDVGVVDIAHKKPTVNGSAVANYSKHSVETSGPNKYLNFSVTDAVLGQTVSGGDSYVDVVLFSASEGSYDLFNNENASYYTFDMDLATDAVGFGGTMQMIGRAGTSFKSSGSTTVSNLGISSATPYKWTHVTVIVKVARTMSGGKNVLNGSKAYVYADGVYKTTFTVASDAEYINCIRFAVSGNNNAKQTLLLDNLFIRAFGADETLASLMSSTSKTLVGEGYPYYAESAKPPVCRVGDQYFGSVNAAIAATANGETIDLIAPCYGETLPKDESRLIRSNGFTFTYITAIGASVTQEVGSSGYTEYRLNAPATVIFYSVDNTTVLETIFAKKNTEVAYSAPLPFYTVKDGVICKVTGWSKTAGGAALSSVKTSVSSSENKFYPVFETVDDSTLFAAIFKADGSVRVLENATDAQNELAFRTALAELRSGDRFVLKQNVVGLSGTILLPAADLTIDLAGHSLTVKNAGKTGSAFPLFEIADGTTLSLISSASGAVIDNRQNASTAGGTLFRMTGKDYHVTVGNGADNLTYYGAMLCDLGTGSGSATFRVLGGTYIRSINAGDGLIAGKTEVLTGVAVTVENAKLISLGGSVFGFVPTGASRENTLGKTTVTVSGSLIAVLGDTAPIITGKTVDVGPDTYTSNIAYTFTGTDLFGTVEPAGLRKVTLGEGCRVSEKTAEERLGTNLVFCVKGATRTETLAAVKDFASLTAKATTFTFAYETVQKENCTTEIWNYISGKSVTEYVSVPSAEKDYPKNSAGVLGKYSYIWTKSVSGKTVTYTESAKSSIGYKARLALWSDFTYELYVPKSDVTAGFIKTATLDGETVTFSEERMIDGVIYYLVTYDALAAKDAAKTVLFETTGKTADGTVLKSAAVLSVPSYCEAVMKGSYGTEAKALAFSILDYVGEAYKYANGNTAEAKIASLLSTYSSYRTAYTADTAANLGTLSNVFEGVSFILTPTVRVRFYLKTSYTGNASVAVAWGASGKSIDLVGGAYNGEKYFDLSIHASDLADVMKVTVSESGTVKATGSYNMANYITGVGEPAVLPLAKSLSTFGKTAKAYKAVMGDIAGEAKEKDPTKLYLAENGVSDYKVNLTATDVGELTRAAADEMVALFRSRGISIASAKNETATSTQHEIVIGYASKRSTCKVDYKTLGGGRGFNIHVQGQRVVLAGASDEANAAAIRYFTSTVLGLDKGTEKLTEVAIPTTFSYQNSPVYDIQSITLGGFPISDYEIVTSGTKAKTYATTLIDRIYRETGVLLTSSTAASGTKKVLKISSASTAPGFVVEAGNGSFTVNCQFSSAFDREADKFFDAFFAKTGAIVYPAGYRYEGDVSIYYSEYGAVGDGVTDDSAAIRAAHEAANSSNRPVAADPGATYYIGDMTSTITVKTNVNWGNANFIIDDTVVDAHRSINIFTLASDYSPRTWTSTERSGVTLTKGQANLGKTFSSEVMLYITWSGHKVYNRYGINANGGSAQQEVISVDKDGTVDPNTPILFDYGGLTTVYEYRVDDTPITVEGGIFTTIANRHARQYTYYDRGIMIMRSNAIIKNVEHRITGEGENGAPYSGFFYVSKCNNILITDCKISGHKTYRLETDENNTMGTYDLGANNANNITWQNLTQLNGITDTTLWGIHGTNYTKNVKLIGSTISRFDAHAGMHNTTIIDSTLGQAFNCIGSGLLYCKNLTRVRGNSFVTLRSDYGSTWEGDALFIDCTLKGFLNDDCTTVSGGGYVFYGTHIAGWDFGYTCYMPQNITLDHFVYEGYGSCYVFNAINASAATDTVNPYQPPKSVTFRNMAAMKTSTNAGTSNDICKNTKIIVE